MSTFKFKKYNPDAQIKKDCVDAAPNHSNGKWGLWNSTRQCWVSRFYESEEEAEAQHCPEAFSGTHTWVGSRCLICEQERRI